MHRRRSARAHFMCGAAMFAAITIAGAAKAADMVEISIPAQSLATALNSFGVQTGRPVMFKPELAAGKQTNGVSSASDPEIALNELLAGTGLTWRRQGDLFLIESASDPQSGSAAGDGADQGTVQALIVTAQKREENIQDVPIAMSAFTQEDLTRSQVAGGPDLITQVPNMTFTKTNFTSYSIQIRGIGTQAISATTDAAVAVALNNSSMIRNNFFEQEFYDLQRVEVLRGPQGTLYGRNATAGVVNIITAKPSFGYEARLSADIGNYSSSRLEGMVNIPLVEDKVALRFAGAWTKRDGFDTNQITGNQIDGRDLWSSRVSLRFEPTDAISANLIWEHFQEDDDRLRSGKQLCKRDDRTELNGVTRPTGLIGYAAIFNQSCIAASLYSPESFQAPDGFSLPFYHPLSQLSLPVISGLDPYLSTTQSTDLRVIESTVEPEYRAKSDVGEFQVSLDLSDNLTLTSETAYSADTLFSVEDYNRFNTRHGVWNQEVAPPQVLKNGVFCDPQLGCSDRLVGADLSTAKSRQFSQEFRVSSDYDGPFNFSVGANFLRYDTEDKYYVFINALSLYSAIGWSPHWPGWLEPGFTIPEYVPNVTDNKGCLINGMVMPDVNRGQPVTGCFYMDPNPIGSLNDQGHNYFLSKNPYKLISYAAFGEAYYEITPSLKLTGGLRFTVDKKEAPRIPSWLLAAESVGYPVAETISQEWREPTGRLALDWKPDVSFTDETLLYASYAHGYKAGGANPPASGIITYGDGGGAVVEGLVHQSATAPKTFKPEFIDAFEVGTKNTLLDGGLTLNLSAFYYDYEGYQISYIVSRSAVNLNFDAKVWGLELETDWRPLENLRIGLKGGYEQTRVADGMRAIDVMDRTAGHEDWMVVRPFPSYPNNCIVPVYTATATGGFAGDGILTLPPNSYQNGNPGPCEFAWVLGRDPLTQLDYVKDPVDGNGFPVQLYFPGYIGFNPAAHPEVNNGEGFYKDLSGKELPNAPKFTATLTADYTLPLSSDWLMALHGDLHYQGESWARIFNTEGYDKLKAYTNLNLAAIFTNEDAGWKVMAYVKNVFDSDSITGAFLNSDDSGLTTNVFLTEPRLYGIRVTKDWSGGSFFDLGERRTHTPGTPYPFQVEIGAMMSRFDGDAQVYKPDWITPALASSLAVQDNDLDWGDVRNIRLTYAPTNGWRISAAYHVGKTNMSDRSAAYEDVAPGVSSFDPTFKIDRDNHAITSLRDSEEYAIADFMVGKDIGLGAFGDEAKSAVAAGLRYASFKSTTHVDMDGSTDSYIAPIIGVKYGVMRYDKFLSSLDTARNFEGTGPAFSWDASVRLWGGDEGGHADIDWTVGGAVLFGKQTSDSSEDRWGQYTHKVGSLPAVNPATQTILYDQQDIPRHRSDNVTVPNVSLSLGVSYSIDRIKVSTGYNWERFFDAIDGGVEASRTYDRTIDGPYFKIAVGFGG